MYKKRIKLNPPKKRVKLSLRKHGSRSTALWGVPTTAKVAFSCVAVVD